MNAEQVRVCKEMVRSGALSAVMEMVSERIFKEWKESPDQAERESLYHQTRVIDRARNIINSSVVSK